MDNHQNEESSVNHQLPQPPQYEVKDVIRRVTIRQMLEADQLHTTAPFKIEGKEFQKVIIIANVCSFREFSTYSDVELDDGTGRIRAHQWNNGSQLDPDQLQVQKLPYVRVIGELEQYKGRKSIRAAKIETVSEPHALYEHILHAIYDTLIYERGPSPPIQITPQPLIDTEADDSLADDSDFAEFYAPPAPPDHVTKLVGPHIDAHTPYPPPRSPDSTVQKEETSEYNPRDAFVPASTGHGKGKAKATTAELLDPISLHEGLGQQLNTFTSVTSLGMGIPSTSGAGRVVLPRLSRGQHSSDHLQYPTTPTTSQTDVHPGSPMAESPPPSSPPSYPATPSSHSPRKPSARQDPFSRLTPLQRDILLHIQAVKSQNARQVSIYPSIDNSGVEDYWKGVAVSDIIMAIRVRYPSLNADKFGEALEYLFEEGYIFTTADDEHYSCI
ncbi:Replication factor A protein 2 [Hypsizygus marmoreus]|uniref:Replication factor A protein 2 n=1 Tax=Hypsizygus marmoreus TaxID=39966 RepID=A0A369JHU9_HYPMA|nr:Replication factor A protein 2 [Hypsizygus marmoreus]